jgi:hypothetical protein
MTTSVNGEQRSKVLPTDPFDVAMDEVSGHPNGAQTQPAVVQNVDHYGNVSSFMVQTVKWAEGNSVFITQVNAQGSARYVLPPKVMAAIARQQEQVTSIVRRRHGKRLAEDRKASGVDLGAALRDPKVRARALKARKAKAAARRARREARIK